MGYVAVISLILAVASAAASAYLTYKSLSAGVTSEPGELKPPTAEEGSTLPVLWGRGRISGVIVADFWNKRYDRIVVGEDGELIVDEAAFKPPGYEYYASIHLLLCQGKLDAVLAIMLGGKVAWSGRVQDDRQQIVINSFGRIPAGGKPGIYGPVEFRLGAVNTVSGADPGERSFLNHRKIGPKQFGVASLVGRDLDFGTSPQLLPWSVVAERTMTINGGADTQWYPEKAQIRIGWGREEEWKYLLQTSADTTDYSDPEYDDSAWDVGQGGIGNADVDADMSLRLENYWVPAVKTSINGTAGFTSDDGYHRSVAEGMKIWMRQDIGRVPAGQPLGVRVWADDDPRCWCNGEEIELKGIEGAVEEEATVGGADQYALNSGKPQYSRWNLIGRIPPDVLVAEGPNVVVLCVRDTFTADGDRIGDNRYIYAGIEVGPDLREPEALCDINPAHILQELYFGLPSPLGCGRGYPESDRDDDAWEAFADTLYDEFFGITLLWNSDDTSTKDCIKEVLRNVAGVVYLDRRTGKFVPKLLRADYDVAELPTLDESNIVRATSVVRGVAGEGVTSAVVKYRKNLAGATATISDHDEGSVIAAGRVIPKVLSFPCITRAELAARIAAREKAALTTPLWAAQLECSRVAASLNIGDVFKWTWPEYGFSEKVMRVLDISRGNGRGGKVTIQCVEDIFASPTPSTLVPDDEEDPPVPTDPPTPREQTALYPARIIDPDNGGSCVCAYLANYFEALGWTETSPGVLEVVIDEGTGMPVWQLGFDGVEPNVYNPNGSPFIRQRVFLGLGTAPASGTKKLAGPWVVDNLGGHWENYGTVDQVWVWENGRMHRPPDFDASEDFSVGKTFHIQSGDTYSNNYATLDTDGVVLRTTEMEWTVASSYSWDQLYGLCTAEQLALMRAAASPAEVTWTTGDAPEMSPGFRTLEGTPGTRTIPAGPWRINIQGAWIDVVGAPSLDPGEYVHLGVRVLATVGESGWTLFEVKLPVTSQTEAPLDPRIYNAPQFDLPDGAQLSLRFCGYTNRVAEIVLHARYQSPERGTYITMPATKKTTPEEFGADEDYYDVWIVDGVLGGFGSHRKLRVHDTGPLLAIETAGLTRKNPRLDCLFVDAGVSITDGATGIPATTAPVACAGGLLLSTARSSLQITLDDTDNTWIVTGSWEAAT